MSLPAVTFPTPAAQAAVVYVCVSGSTRLDPWGSGVVEITTRNVILPGSVRLAQAHPLTTPPAMRKQPSAGLGPVTVHRTQSGVDPWNDESARTLGVLDVDGWKIRSTTSSCRCFFFFFFIQITSTKEENRTKTHSYVHTWWLSATYSFLPAGLRCCILLSGRHEHAAVCSLLLALCRADSRRFCCACGP